MKRFVSPSILAANFNNLEKEVGVINRSKAGWLHCDVMDGVYVPNISFGFPVIEALKKASEKPLDVHLMIVEPEKYIERFCKIGIDILTVHIETCKHPEQSLRLIRKLGVKAGVSINAYTPVESLSDVISLVDIVLIMSVNAGFGGQNFMENTYEKVDKLRKMADKANGSPLIQVDGGIDMNNARKLYDHGVNILVCGTTVFHSTDPIRTIDELLTV
jgi:ribulose-phosphate 3-epimerase